MIDIWIMVTAYGLWGMYQTWILVYPADPKPVSEGEIEDAVIIHSWREAFVLNQDTYRLWYTFMMIAVLFSFS